MADGRIDIDTKLDTSGLDKGLKDMQGKLDKAGKSIDAGAGKAKGFSGALKGLNAGTIASGAAFAAAAVAIKKTVDVLNDCAAAYKVQQKAETALQVAAKNNPYLNNESVANLKNFASQLQSMSEIGDEVSLKVMSQLAATGRSEQQIMQIMSAAADMAAVTGEDIASAAQKLNATLNGNAGQLGRQNSAINALTKQELEAGKAIELVAKQYKGSAQAMADETVQLNNAWGDFKENIGKAWAEKTAPIKRFFTDLLTQINNVNSAIDKNYLGDAILNAEEKIETRLDKIKYYEEGIKELESGGMFDYTIAEARQNIAQLRLEIGKIQAMQGANANRQNREQKEAQQKAKEEATIDRNKKAADIIDENTRAINAQIRAAKLKAELTGEEIDAQEIYNAVLNSYVDLVTKSNGLITENNQAAKNRLKLLEEWKQKAQEAADAEERLTATKNLVAEADGIIGQTRTNNDTVDSFIDKQNHLVEMRDAVLAYREEMGDKEVDIEKKTKDRLNAIDEEMAQNRRDLWNGLASDINSFAQQTAQVIQDAASLALETEKTRMQAELANIELLYRKGEMGEEEYQRKTAEAKKKGAKLQYQIEMAQWGGQILAATANTAVGVTQAFAQNGPIGIITGALVAAAGAVQLATIMAAKPKQNFATGGFIGGMNGASLGSDNTMINARTGELVMNAAQQRNLWDMLNGGSASLGGSGIELTVNNSASNLVTATPQINKNQIELMIDARVNDGLRNGRFNDGLNSAQSSMTGEFYGT